MHDCLGRQYINAVCADVSWHLGILVLGQAIYRHRQQALRLMLVAWKLVLRPLLCLCVCPCCDLICAGCFQGAAVFLAGNILQFASHWGLAQLSRQRPGFSIPSGEGRLRGRRGTCWFVL